MSNGNRSVSSMLCSWLVVNCKAKNISRLSLLIPIIQHGWNWIDLLSLLLHCVVNGVFDANLSQNSTHNYTCLTVRVKIMVQSLLSIISHTTNSVKQTQNKLTESRKSNSFSTFVVGTSLPDACDKRIKMWSKDRIESLTVI